MVMFYIKWLLHSKNFFNWYLLHLPLSETVMVMGDVCEPVSTREKTLMRTFSLEKTLMLRKIEGRRRRDDRGRDGWRASPTWWTWVWASSGAGDGQGSLACCSPWGCKESDTTDRLNKNKHVWTVWALTSSDKVQQLCSQWVSETTLTDIKPPFFTKSPFLRARSTSWLCGWRDGWGWGDMPWAPQDAHSFPLAHSLSVSHLTEGAMWHAVIDEASTVSVSEIRDLKSLSPGGFWFLPSEVQTVVPQRREPGWAPRQVSHTAAWKSVNNAAVSRPDGDPWGAKLSLKPKEEKSMSRKERGWGGESIGKGNEWYARQFEHFPPQAIDLIEGES